MSDIMKVDPRLYSRGGIITERDPDRVIIRLRIPAGMLTPEQTIGIGKIARTYGDGRVHLTVRQTIEIPGVDPDRIVPMLTALKDNGTPLGSERQEIVNITACMGTDHCKYANIDSLSLAREIDERYFGKEMPVKVRIAVSACPNGVYYFGDKLEDAVTNGTTGETVRFSELIRENAGYTMHEELGTKPQVYYLPPRNRRFPYQKENIWLEADHPAQTPGQETNTTH